MKKILNGAVLIIGLLLVSRACISDQNERAVVPSNPPPVVQNAEQWQVKPGSVYDGDTLRVIRSSEEKKIRFACIDAPEVKQAGGIEARDYLRSLLSSANNQVYVEPVDEDRYGRTVALLWIDRGKGKELVQQIQVESGTVWAYERYKDNCNQWKAIDNGMKQAQAARSGIWAGNPQSPWLWRKANK